MYKNTLLTITNKSNAWKSKVFHIYRHGKNSRSKLSFLTRSSVKRLVVGKKIEIRRKKKIFTLLVRTTQWTSRFDGSQRKFRKNEAVILKKNANLTNEKVVGPTLWELSRRKYINFFESYF